MSTVLAWIVWICLGVQAVHYLGYPALIALIAKLRPQAVRKAPIAPQVSLIISAYNEASVIGEKLENSLALDWPGLEIIVNSEGSTDDTAEIVATYEDRGIIGIAGPDRRGKALALAAAATRARGDILVFSDANAFYDRNAIRALIANFADPDVGCVSGRKTVRPAGTAGSGSAAQSEGLYWRYENKLKALESTIASSAGTVGEMLALRRNLFQPIPKGIINDDAYLALRTLNQGYRVIFEPAAQCWEEASASLAEDSERRGRITAGRYQLFSQTGLWPWQAPLTLFILLAHKGLRLLLPCFMIGALAANAVLMLPAFEAGFALKLAFIGQMLFYGSALLGALLERRGKSWRLPRLSLYLTTSNLASLVGLWRYLTGTQSVLWEKIAR